MPFIIALALMLAASAPAEVDLSYLTADRERLNPAAEKILQEYLSQPESWAEIGAGFAKISGARVIGFGETHGAPGHDGLVARALEYGKPAGVDTLLLEMNVSCQPALDRYAAGKMDLGRLIAEDQCQASYTPKTIEAAKRLGIRIIAIDDQSSSERNRFMYERSVKALKSSRKAILYCGREHIYSAFDIHLQEPSLGFLLKNLLGESYVSINMLADKSGAPIKVDFPGLPQQAIIATAGSPISEIPEDWIIDAQSTTWWRFGDSDYLAVP